MKIAKTALVTILLGSLTLTSAVAQATAAVSVSGEEPDGVGNPSYTLGFSFSLESVLSVYALGIYDSGSDGLADAYPIGLWNSSGTLVASATLGLDTATTLVDKFRYMNIAPLTLVAGTYKIGALYASDHDKVVFSGLPGDITSAAGVTYLGAAYAAGNTLANPTNSAGMSGYLGPNFQFEATAVPEPEAWILMIAGFGMVGVRCAAVRRREAGLLSEPPISLEPGFVKALSAPRHTAAGRDYAIDRCLEGFAFEKE